MTLEQAPPDQSLPTTAIQLTSSEMGGFGGPERPLFRVRVHVRAQHFHLCAQVARLAWRAGTALLPAGMAILLCSFPWVLLASGQAWSLQDWILWVVAVAVHAVWLTWHPSSLRRVLPAASLVTVLGFLAVQLLLVCQEILHGGVLKDYFNYLTLISLAGQSFSLAPTNLIPLLNTPYFQYSFDPLVPLLDRVIPLTSSPFYLLAFQTLALWAPALVLWAIAIREPALRPFQFFLPALYLLLPAVATTIQYDYHTSGIGLSLLLLGTYWAFRRPRVAWLPLLVGTLTKVSYWPCFVMFSLVSLLAHRWRLAALYAGGFVLAMGLYQHLQTGPSYSLIQFYGGLGGSLPEILRTLLTRPDVVLPLVAQAGKWLFLLHLLLPVGLVGALLYPPALLPALPLVAMTLLDYTTYRSSMTAEYALEYVPFLFGAFLLVLRQAGPRRRTVLVLLAAGGTVASFFLYQGYDVDWSAPDIAGIVAAAPPYFKQVQFVDCARGNDPVLATDYHWASLLRGDYQDVWFDEGDRPDISPTTWAQFDLLVFPGQATAAGNLLNLSSLRQSIPKYDGGDYASLRARLPILVRAPGLAPVVTNWYYEGGNRLASCAQQFDYPIVSSDY